MVNGQLPLGDKRFLCFRGFVYDPEADQVGKMEELNSKFNSMASKFIEDEEEATIVQFS